MPPDSELIAALRAGDERAFGELVDTHSPALLRVALGYVPSQAVAEEVVQETWIAVMKGIGEFEARSSLKTWIFRILVNIAMKSGGREGRSISFTALTTVGEDAGPTIPPEHFLPDDHAEWPGHWAVPPTTWPTPEEGLLTGETRAIIIAALDDLPPMQRDVIALRDIAGWNSEDVCDALEITAANQRVLLHRARSKVRVALEDYFGATEVVTDDAVSDT